MTTVWRTPRLGDVVCFEKDQDVHVGLPYVGLEHIESGTGRYLGGSEATSVRSATFRFSPDHVLYGRLRPYLNKVLLPDFEGHCSTEIFPIKPRAEVLREYLFYWLLNDSTVRAIDATSKGARMPRADMNAVLGMTFPLPPLPEQRRIVAILDEAFAGIATARANAEKNVRSAKELASIGYQAITSSFDQSNWPTLSVAAVAAQHKGAIRTGPFGSQLLHSEFVHEGVAVLGIDNAVGNEFRWDRRRFITAEKYRQLVRYRVLPGDVLITIMGTCGRCAVVPDDIPLAINTKHLCCITLDQSRCLPEFLHAYFLNSPKARDYLSAQAKGSIMNGLNMGIMSELPVHLPPLGVQAEIANRFASLRAECLRVDAIQKEKISLLDEFKQSLLHQAFTGQLTCARPVAITSPEGVQSATPQFAANVICIAHARHVRRQREKTFGRVKEQKLLHLVEAIGGIDLGRRPIKDAAGPNDFRHMLKAEAWAKEQNLFELIERDGGYEFRKLKNFDAHLVTASRALGPHADTIKRVIDLLIPMNSREAEVFATVHAAWNNLLMDGADVTDDSIVLEARDRWHPAKLSIPENEFRRAIAMIRAKGLAPNGSGKYVGGQQNLPLPT